MSTEFQSAMEHFIKTGEAPTGTDFLVDQAISLINRSKNHFWILLRTERPQLLDKLYALSRAELMSIIDDMEERIHIPTYKKLKMFEVQTIGGKIVNY